MSFHGGLLGAIASMVLFARRGRAATEPNAEPPPRTFLQVGDYVAPLVPLGVGFGRLGNFINAELPGRLTDSALGMHFPCWSVEGLSVACYGTYDTALRHVSSLYQAFGEGLVLFAIVWWFSARPRAVGQVSGCFLLASGIIRFTTEFFREPDVGIGFVAFDWVTMGQLLSLPTAAFGAFLLLRGTRFAVWEKA